MPKPPRSSGSCHLAAALAPFTLSLSSLECHSLGFARAIWLPHMSEVEQCQYLTQGGLQAAGISCWGTWEAARGPWLPQLANGEGDDSPFFSQLGQL